MLFATYAWFMHGFVYYCPSENLSSVHLFLMPLSWLSSLAIFLIGSNSDPGQISKSNLKSYLLKSKFDPYVFKNDIECKECKIKKIPGSKHCY